MLPLSPAGNLANLTLCMLPPGEWIVPRETISDGVRELLAAGLAEQREADGALRLTPRGRERQQAADRSRWVYRVVLHEDQVQGRATQIGVEAVALVEVLLASRRAGAEGRVERRRIGSERWLVWHRWRRGADGRVERIDR